MGHPILQKGEAVPESRDVAVFVAEQLSSGGVGQKLLPKEGPERQKVIEMLDLHDTLPIEPLTQVDICALWKIQGKQLLDTLPLTWIDVFRRYA